TWTRARSPSSPTTCTGPRRTADPPELKGAVSGVTRYSLDRPGDGDLASGRGLPRRRRPGPTAAPSTMAGGGPGHDVGGGVPVGHHRAAAHRPAAGDEPGPRRLRGPARPARHRVRVDGGAVRDAARDRGVPG